MPVNGTDRRFGDDGLSKVAHAIRRSSALSAALQVTTPKEDESDDDYIVRMLANADVLARWVGGKAAAGDGVEGQEGRPSWQP